jgi:TRAP-type C4-dicarboxylate transport system permease small subunit
MNDLAGIIMLLGVLIFACLLAFFGFRLLTAGTKQETTIIKLGSFELTLSTLVGGILILGAVFVIYSQIQRFYPSK